jgi:hypothetical protein
MKKIDLDKVSLRVDLDKYNEAIKDTLKQIMKDVKIGGDIMIPDEYAMLNKNGNLEICIDVEGKTYKIYEVDDFIIME